MRPAGGAVATLAAFFVLAAPALAKTQTKTETADAGTVHAQLTYTLADDELAAKGIHLTITDNGVVTTDEQVPDSDSLLPTGAYRGHSLAAADLDGDGTVEVVVGMFSGGAHCCTSAWIYHAGQKTEHDFLDAGYRLKDLDGDGRPEFLSADARFAYAFSSYASSIFPLLVLDWQGTQLVDVTGTLPALRPRLTSEAAKFHRYYVRARKRIHRGRGHYDIGDVEVVRSALAAYVADECTLGDCHRGWRAVRKAVRRHDVRPSGTRFERNLRRFLRRLGYTS